MNAPRSTIAPAMPANRIGRWRGSGTRSAEKISAKTNRLSSDRLFSTTNPARYACAGPGPRHTHSTAVNARPSTVHRTLHTTARRMGISPLPNATRSSTSSAAVPARNTHQIHRSTVNGDSFRLIDPGQSKVSPAQLRPCSTGRRRAGATGPRGRTDDGARRGYCPSVVAQSSDSIRIRELTDGGQTAAAVAAEVASFVDGARRTLDLAHYDF